MIIIDFIMTLVSHRFFFINIAYQYTKMRTLFVFWPKIVRRYIHYRFLTN